MKLSVKPNILKYLVLGAGALGLLLRFLLYATGMDEQGLLLRNHICSYLIGALNIAAAAAIWLLTRTVKGPELYRECYPTSIPAGVGCILAALGILITTLGELSAANSTQLLVTVLGFAAVLMLVLLSFCRLCGYEPFFLFYAVVCVYFAIRMVSQYRQWSADPQLQDYCYQLCACVGLMLTSYHHAAFGAGMGNHRRLWLFSLATVYLCCLTLAGPSGQLFYLSAGIWVFTNMTNLTAKPRRRRPTLNLEET